MRTGVLCNSLRYGPGGGAWAVRRRGGGDGGRPRLVTWGRRAPGHATRRDARCCQRVDDDAVLKAGYRRLPMLGKYVREQMEEPTIWEACFRACMRTRSYMHAGLPQASWHASRPGREAGRQAGSQAGRLPLGPRAQCGTLALLQCVTIARACDDDVLLRRVLLWSCRRDGLTAPTLESHRRSSRASLDASKTASETAACVHAPVPPFLSLDWTFAYVSAGGVLHRCRWVGLVLDLTNSHRYYRFNDEYPDAEGKGLFYRKVCAMKRPAPAGVGIVVGDLVECRELQTHVDLVWFVYPWIWSGGVSMDLHLACRLQRLRLQRLACLLRALPAVAPSLPQVPCRGKGQSPQPEAVNQAVYEIWAFLQHFPHKFVLVHCTHGFNRTGAWHKTMHAVSRRRSAACLALRVMANLGDPEFGRQGPGILRAWLCLSQRI
eukprot:364638-Chlamydomonas_euryale.AAC.3